MPSDIKTLTPTFIIYIDGTRLAVEYEYAVKQILVVDRINAPSTCSIFMADDTRALADGDTFSEGHQISIHLGYKDAVEEVFNGEIVGMSIRMMKNTGSTVVVKCANTIHRLFRSRKHRVFSEMKEDDVIKEIASENGLAGEIDSIGTEKMFFVQKDKTDYDFIMEIAGRYGCAVWAKDKKLFVKKETETSGGDVILEWGKTLIEFNGEVDTSKIITEVEIRGWDHENAQGFSGIMTYQDVQSLGGSTAGGKTVEDNFSVAAMTMADIHVKDQSEAENMALNILKQNSFQYSRAQGTCEGEPLLNAGHEIEIKELGGRFSGVYLVLEAKHQFNTLTGYTTSFSLARNAIG